MKKIVLSTFTVLASIVRCDHLEILEMSELEFFKASVGDSILESGKQGQDPAGPGYITDRNL